MSTPTIQPPPFATMFIEPDEVGKPSSLILMGGEGSRKTTNLGYIAAVPEYADARFLMLDFEGGSKVYATGSSEEDKAVRRAIKEKRFNIVRIDKTDPTAYQQVLYYLGHRDEKNVFHKGEAFKYGYDVLIIDTLDTLQSIPADWYTANTFTKEGELNTLAGFGNLKAWTTDMMWAIQNDPNILGLLSVHVEETATETGKVSIGPLLTGSAKNLVGGIVDSVIYLKKEPDPAAPKDEGKARIVATLDGDGHIKAKNRWRLPAKIQDFTLPLFFDMIRDQSAVEEPAPEKTPAAKKAA